MHMFIIVDILMMKYTLISNKQFTYYGLSLPLAEFV